MSLFKFDPEQLIHRPQEIVAFVDWLIERMVQEGSYYRGEDRRIEERHRVAISVTGMPVDDNMQPAAEAFEAVTRDISRSGLALFHSQPVTTKFLAVQLIDLDGHQFEAVVQVLRCRPIGPVFEIAGRFVTIVHEAPEKPNST